MSSCRDLLCNGQDFPVDNSISEVTSVYLLYRGASSYSHIILQDFLLPANTSVKCSGLDPLFQFI